jgi:hypothetical protein
MLVVTGKYDQFIQEWRIPDSPTHRPAILVARTATRGTTVSAVVLFSNCQPSPNGNCSAEADFKVTKPDGTSYGEFKANELWKNAAPPVDVLILSPAVLGIHFEANDPLGEYTIETTVKDKVANRELVLRRQIKLLDGDPRPASDKPSFLPEASSWTYIDTDNQGNRWFIDKASIVPNLSMISAWERIDFKLPQPYPGNGRPIQHIYALNILNCKDQKVGVKASSLLGADGSKVAEHVDNDTDIQWKSVSPESVTHKVMTYLCASTKND